MKNILILLTMSTLPLYAQNTPNQPGTPGYATPTNQTTPSSAIEGMPGVPEYKHAPPAPPRSMPTALTDGFPVPPDTVRISGGVSAGLLLHKKDPKYPEEARKAHVEGAVIFTALIGADGKVTHLIPESGPQMLRQESMDTVSKWTYRPYVLQGKPVPMLTTITAKFSLED